MSIEFVKHSDATECTPQLHSWVPVIEGKQTVGLVCTVCGKAVRENMQYSEYGIDERGLTHVSVEKSHRRKDPRF